MFYRSFIICVVAIVTPAIGVMVAIRIHGGDISVGALTLQCVLGAVLFTDLIMVLLDRLEIVLRSWLSGIAAAGLVAASAMFAITRQKLGLVHRRPCWLPWCSDRSSSTAARWYRPP